MQKVFGILGNTHLHFRKSGKMVNRVAAGENDRGIVLDFDLLFRNSRQQDGLRRMKGWNSRATLYFFASSKYGDLSLSGLGLGNQDFFYVFR